MTSLRAILKQLKNRLLLDAPTRRYIEFNEKKWKAWSSGTGDAVVLVDFFEVNCQIHGWSHVANFLAKKFHARIEAYSFEWGRLSKIGVPRRRLRKIYESFGATVKLTYPKERARRKAARLKAGELLAKLKTKSDVLDIKFDGLVVGDLIYDSYLRQGRATLDLGDSDFFEILVDAFLIQDSVKEYFERNDVRAVIAIHPTYIWYGIVIRTALRKKIPAFFVSPETFRIFEFNAVNSYFMPFHDFRTIFQGFEKSERIEAHHYAKTSLQARVSGKFDKMVGATLADGSRRRGGYGDVKAEPILKATGRPRGLVLLHCLFDAAHYLGPTVFEDFWEWNCSLLEWASTTEFDWYVKPHPDGLPGNEKFVEELKLKFPKVTFLDSSASNRQIIAEGINAMFTVCGTAAHEFAYLGVPVVTAGANPQSAYNFNFHPQTKDEVEWYVRNLDKLKIDIKQSDVEEFFFMYYFHYQAQTNEMGAFVIDESLWFSSVGLKAYESSSFDEYMRISSPERDQKINAYLEKFFSPYLNSRT